MVKERVIFVPGMDRKGKRQTLMDNNELENIVRKLLLSRMKENSFRLRELSKVGKENNSAMFRFSIRSDGSNWHELCNVQDVDFIAKALAEVKKYKVYRGEVYLEDTKSEVEASETALSMKDRLFAIGDKPVLRVITDMATPTLYIYRKVSIINPDGEEELVHDPLYDPRGESSSATLSLNARNLRKVPLISGIYRAILKRYKNYKVLGRDSNKEEK